MLLPKPLHKARLVRRYKRFLADVELNDGSVVTAHCANPGAMTGLASPGMAVWLSRSDDPKRKLAWSWELVEVDDGAGRTLVGVNTSRPNAIAAEAIEQGLVPELTGYTSLRREVGYGKNSRVDILLEAEGRPPAYVEVKNAHLSRAPGLAEFPDSVTKRGAKHLDELAAMVAAGARSVMFFLVHRGDADRFSLAADIDPGYAAAYRAASAAGVEAIAYACRISETEVIVDRRVPIVLGDG